MSLDQRQTNPYKRDAQRDSIALLVNENLTGNIIVNHLIQPIRNIGLEPIIVVLHPKPPERADIKELQDFSFYDSTIGRETIFPFLEEKVTAPALQNHHSFRQIQRKFGIKLFDVEDVNTPETTNLILDCPRLIGGISIRNLLIFRPETIQAFEQKGFLWNLHAGLLPQYRGVHPQLRAIENGDDICGWTLHEIDAGIDTGKILGSTCTPLETRRPSYYLTEFFKKLPTAAPLIMRHIRIERGLEVPPPETCCHKKESPRYYTFPTSVEMQKMKREGITLANSSHMLNFYTDLYGPQNAPHLSEEFRKVVQERIGMWESSKVKRPAVENTVEKITSPLPLVA